MLEKKYNFQESEEKWQKFWEEAQVYKFDRSRPGEIYSIDTPPPTVSGSLHIGHVFSYAQAEMMARFHRMQGKNIFYPFGFDDNGLPTERLVEREEGIRAKDLSRSEFTGKCLNTTGKYEQEFKKLWKSLGFSADWNLQYETVSPLSQRISQRSFLDLVAKGKAYVRETPVLWCTACQTSIAQAELETAEKETAFNWIPFLVDGEELPVATTRPELLFGCVALFIHPEDERYGRYIGKEATVPLYEFPIPVLGDRRVSREKGSGIVMCATFGDMTDLEWFREYGLPYKKVVAPDGTIHPEVPHLAGYKVAEARTQIIRLLREQGLLKKYEEMRHHTAVHERCGKPVEIIPSRQWFISILEDKDRFLQAGGSIRWFPAAMKTRYEAWVENIKWDWCISRQRFFGVPLPVWYCKACGEPVFASEEQLPVNPLESSPLQACACGCSEFTPEEAVMDTWATSSVTPMINGRWKEADDFTDRLLPMRMRTQAHEIIRTWAFYTIVKSLYHTGRIPWKEIMVCGFVKAKDGEKISKSKGNSAFSPAALISRHSADAIRYWAASARLGTDTLFSEEDLKASHRFLTKLWNAARFALIHLEDYRGEKVEKPMPVDRWILERLQAVYEKAGRFLEEYEIGLARHEMDAFFWRDFCDNYLEIIKERLYQPEIHGDEARRSAQYALYHALLGILKLYAIYIPHMTEELYQAFFKEREKELSIHQSLWEKERDEEPGILRFGEDLARVLEEVRRFKSERNLSMKVPLGAIAITVPAGEAAFFEASRRDLTACTGAGALTIAEGEDLKIEIVQNN